MVAAFPQIFHSSPLSCALMMCILINETSRNVALDGKPYLWTFTLLSRGGISPQTTFVDSYDQPPISSFTNADSYNNVYPSSDYQMSLDWAPDPTYKQIYTIGPITPTLTISSIKYMEISGVENSVLDS